MAASSEGFSVKDNGYDTPCVLMSNADDVVVRFDKGLDGSAEFFEKYSGYEDEFTTFGIDVRRAQLHEAFIGKTFVKLNDAAFGKAFYLVYFPEMQRSVGDAVSYEWKVLSAAEEVSPEEKRDT